MKYALLIDYELGECENESILSCKSFPGNAFPFPTILVGRFKVTMNVGRS